MNALNRPVFIFIAAALTTVIFSGHTAVGETLTTLWEIGRPDNDIREFALAPDGYNGFADDAFFVAGKSDPRTAWPYIQPGPKDAWAGGKQHTFTVVFGLGAVPDGGVFRYTIDLVNTHHTVPPFLEVTVNGYTAGFQMPKGGSDASLTGAVSEGKEYRFSGTVPASALREGINMLSIASTDGSWIIYDSLSFEGPSGVSSATVPETAVQAVATPQILDAGVDGLTRIIRATIFNTVKDREVTLSCAGLTVKKRLDPGENTVEISVPASDTDVNTVFEVSADGKSLARKELTLKPVRKWTVCFLPHSHVDIGYTHLQSDVMHRQWDNIADAIALAEKTAGYPEGARFKWNLEVLWPVERLLAEGSADRKRSFIEAARKGQVGIDALYGSMLTGLARPEELFRFTSFGRSLRREYGFTVNSAMITDVPGYVWGMVPALALSGVKYFNPGPNHMPLLPHQGDRIGYTSEAWGDKPFWWVSPSGEERVLVWIPTHGYSWFHDWIVGRIRKAGIDPILGYLDELETKDYPYDMVQLRYTVGADNGPPDPGLPDFVRDWNAKHTWPRLVIATTGEMFGEFERRYGDKLPVYRGDFTPYWEDGAASTALETALNRTAAERLVDAAALWSLTNPKGYPAKDFDEAWRNVILYTEHTWGAHNSISEPESDFVKGQWAVKRQFAVTADSLSKSLLTRALGPVKDSGGVVRFVDVYNTSSWPRTDVVTLPSDWKTPGDRVKAADGADCLSQRLSTGELAFLAETIPPFGSKRFALETGKSTAKGRVTYGNGTLSNGILTAAIDSRSGAIEHLERDGFAGNFADTAKGGLNGYFYLSGKDPKDARPAGKSTAAVKENGPLFVTLVITSEAPGCTKLTREVTMYSGLDRLDIADTPDRKRVPEKESVHFAFPFDVPDGQIRYDVAWGVVRPDIDQLTGGNRNVFSIERWADVSNDTRGVTLASLDAPLIEIADMNAEAWNLSPDRPWLKSVPRSQTIYSYVMNNYWHTNYKAYQEGPVTFRYSLLPHGPFESASAKRFGMERSHPLVAAWAGQSSPVFSLKGAIGDNGIVVTSVVPADNGESLLIRVFNTSDAPVVLTPPPFENVKICGIDGENEKAMTAPITMKGYAIRTLKVKTPSGGK